MSYQVLRWAVGDEQVDRALASVADDESRERAIARLAAGDTIDAAGNWTPYATLRARLEVASLAEWLWYLAPCEALASRDPGRAP